MELVHENVRNKIYSSNAEDVELCLKLALNTALLYTVSGLDVYNYKINKKNEIYTILKENGITMEVRDINYGISKLITFYKNGKIILESEFTFKYMG